MKIRKVQSALKKAEGTRRANEAALSKIETQLLNASEGWRAAKLAYKKARRALKQAKKQVGLHLKAQKVIQGSLKKNGVLVEKLKRKLRKAEKKGTKTTSEKPGARGAQARQPRRSKRATGGSRSATPRVVEEQPIALSAAGI